MIGLKNDNFITFDFRNLYITAPQLTEFHEIIKCILFLENLDDALALVTRHHRIVGYQGLYGLGTAGF